MRLEDLLCAVLDVPALDASSGSGDVEAWDSLAHLSVVSAVEETYGVTLSSSEMRDASSVASIRALLASRGIQA